MEINRIGNKNCWIKNGFQHWRFFNRGCLLILGDHLFFNCIFFFARRRLINNGMLINPDLALFVYLKSRIFKCSYRRYIYIYIVSNYRYVFLLWTSKYECSLNHMYASIIYVDVERQGAIHWSVLTCFWWESQLSSAAKMTTVAWNPKYIWWIGWRKHLQDTVSCRSVKTLVSCIGLPEINPLIYGTQEMIGCL
jgi:hypothetical protein